MTGIWIMVLGSAISARLGWEVAGKLWKAMQHWIERSKARRI